MHSTDQKIQYGGFGLKINPFDSKIAIWSQLIKYTKYFVFEKPVGNAKRTNNKNLSLKIPFPRIIFLLYIRIFSIDKEERAYYDKDLIYSENFQEKQSLSSLEFLAKNEL